MEEERLRQQIHELKLALETANSLNEDSAIENERLISDLSDKNKEITAVKKSHENEIRSLKDQILNMANDHETEKLALEGKVAEYEALIEKAKSEKHVAPDSSELDRVINEVINEKQNNAKLTEEIDKMKDENEELKMEKHLVDQKLTEVLRMYEETRESLDIKKIDLTETQNALKECQEEKALLSAQLDILKTGPASDVERGNSLFKEVEDNRKKMAAAYKNLKMKYLSVQNVLTLKNQEISRLKGEISSLKNYELKFDEDSKKANSKYIGSCEKRIKELEALVCLLDKRKESPEIVTISESNHLQLQWVHTIVNEARQEARKTIAECNKMSSDSYDKASALYRAEAELKHLKIEVIRKDGRIEELESKISDLQNEMKENIAAHNVVPEESLLTSKGSNKTVRFADDSALEETCMGTK